MANIVFEKLILECGPHYNQQIEESVKYIVDTDGYKIYTPYLGCTYFLSTKSCQKCVDFVQKKMLENTLDTTKPLYIPTNL